MSTPEREPTELTALLSSTVRGRRFTVYIPPGGFRGDITADKDELEIAGHVVTDDELDRGWVVVGEWL